MLEITFRARLGNQMFQYAYASALARRLDRRLTADLWWYVKKPDSFELWRFAATGLRPVALIRDVLHRVAKDLPFTPTLRDYSMYEMQFDPRALQVGDGFRLNGWFQSPRYFEADADRIRREFDLGPFLPAADLEALRRQAQGRPLVAVHVRRGDYVSDSRFFLDDYDSYYSRAFSHQAAVLGETPYLVVISDDPAWCRRWPLLRGLDHHVYEPPGASSALRDMALIAACDHNIITNSTFSWWGAWLGDPGGRVVVMPRMWFTDRTTDACDLCVPGWVQL